MLEPTLLEVGRIGRAHGVRGELYVDLITDRTERLDAGARLKADAEWLTVVDARPAGNRWLVLFEGIADRSAAEAYSGRRLLAEPLAPKSGIGDLYAHELIGADVVELDGTSHGRCISIVANPAHDLLELEGGALVPVVFVVSVADGRVVINPPDGLFDL